MTTLLAIDPADCGCTECLIGEYRPLRDATDEEIQALFRGELRDNTGNLWLLTQKSQWASDGFEIHENGRSIDIPRIVLPVPVEVYRLDISNEVIDQIYRGDPFIGA